MKEALSFTAANALISMIACPVVLGNVDRI
jgi:hypothetical protein